MLVGAAVGRPGAHRTTAFAGVIAARLAIDPLADLEAMAQPDEETGESLFAHGQTQEPAQAQGAPGGTGLAVEPLVRLGLVRAPDAFARAADTLVDALRKEGSPALQAGS